MLSKLKDFWLGLKELSQMRYELSSLRCRNQELRAELEDFRRTLQATTDLHVDAPGYHDPGIVILLGRRNGQQYFHMYNTSEADFVAFAKHLRHLERTTTLKTLDCPPTMRGFFNEF